MYARFIRASSNRIRVLLLSSDHIRALSLSSNHIRVLLLSSNHIRVFARRKKRSIEVCACLRVVAVRRGVVREA